MQHGTTGFLRWNTLVVLADNVWAICMYSAGENGAREEEGAKEVNHNSQGSEG
jgi:hypothetical protein